ncbi:hypothetical protein DACRYDRAFT_117670 [Dacryopinax primogenitus]|uniref:Uncharacterized protein n=1 Tax=Dacryopinax primogenitus (strain DJM 731) TaxID=1858805 RepID=M5G2K2_DACPD|nr:uncharacterized protein DACRYDRAFT_117670 [Dacryopinax primogenitus]EJU00082.1 hypothetical protein DACRYDRAFT_117670 [Dacryopinax primogenitus]
MASLIQQWPAPPLFMVCACGLWPDYVEVQQCHHPAHLYREIPNFFIPALRNAPDDEVIHHLPPWVRHTNRIKPNLKLSEGHTFIILDVYRTRLLNWDWIPLAQELKTVLNDYLSNTYVVSDSSPIHDVYTSCLHTPSSSSKSDARGNKIETCEHRFMVEISLEAARTLVEDIKARKSIVQQPDRRSINSNASGWTYKIITAEDDTINRYPRLNTLSFSQANALSVAITGASPYTWITDRGDAATAAPAAGRRKRARSVTRDAESESEAAPAAKRVARGLSAIPEDEEPTGVRRSKRLVEQASRRGEGRAASLKPTSLYAPEQTNNVAQQLLSLPPVVTSLPSSSSGSPAFSREIDIDSGPSNSSCSMSHNSMVLHSKSLSSFSAGMPLSALRLRQPPRGNFPTPGVTPLGHPAAGPFLNSSPMNTNTNMPQLNIPQTSMQPELSNQMPKMDMMSPTMQQPPVDNTSRIANTAMTAPNSLYTNGPQQEPQEPIRAASQSASSTSSVGPDASHPDESARSPTLVSPPPERGFTHPAPTPGPDMWRGASHPVPEVPYARGFTHPGISPPPHPVIPGFERGFTHSAPSPPLRMPAVAEHDFANPEPTPPAQSIPSIEREVDANPSPSPVPTAPVLALVRSPPPVQPMNAPVVAQPEAALVPSRPSSSFGPAAPSAAPAETALTVANLPNVGTSTLSAPPPPVTHFEFTAFASLSIGEPVSMRFQTRVVPGPIPPPAPGAWISTFNAGLLENTNFGVNPLDAIGTPGPTRGTGSGTNARATMPEAQPQATQEGKKADHNPGTPNAAPSIPPGYHAYIPPHTIGGAGGIRQWAPQFFPHRDMPRVPMAQQFAMRGPDWSFRPGAPNYS